MRCGKNCGFVKDGFYPRNFVFLHIVVTGVSVQRYHCKAKSYATFSALVAFQEPQAQYSVQVRGAALEQVFLHGMSIRSCRRTLRKHRGAASLARSTVSDWCRGFRDLAPGHAAVLRAHLAQLLPPSDLPAGGDPDSFLRLARVAFGLYRAWPRERFWEWLHDLLLRDSDRHLLSA